MAKIHALVFTAPWCSECKSVARIMRDIAAVLPISLQIIDVDKNRETANEYRVRSVPTVLIFKRKAIMKVIVGARPKGTYIDAINNAWRASPMP